MKAGSNSHLRMARVGVLLDSRALAERHGNGRNAFEVYLTEILRYAGVPFRELNEPAQISAHSVDIVIAALVSENPDSLSTLWRFAEQGGSVIALANLSALADRLGCESAPLMEIGYAAELSCEMRPLRFLSALPWTTTGRAAAQVVPTGVLLDGNPHGKTGAPAILRFRLGTGILERWAVEPATTVVELQQGRGPVVQDGPPAPDGSAPIDEGILKADDGFTQDWEWDRAKTPTGQPYFSNPYADLWREALIGRLFALALERGLTLPFIDYWPAGVSQVALVSHDSDCNTDESAETTLTILRNLGIRSTWCLMEPGYSPQICRQIRANGHEIAFHYNAVAHEKYAWDDKDFGRQLEGIRSVTGLSQITSNKNHLTRFEGWGDLFRWLESAGIAVDQTRGPSKRGNVGFLFATCHPYFPIAWSDEANRLYDVLEIGFLTQDMDLGNWADTSVIDPFLEQVQQVRGVAHFLFHPVHLHTQEKVRGAIATVVREARQRGFVFWTSREINEWVRARRALRVDGVDSGGRAVISRVGAAEGAASRMAVWAPLSVRQPLDHAGMAERFGLWCAELDYSLAT